MKTPILFIFFTSIYLSSCGQNLSTIDIHKSCSYYGENISEDIYQFSSSKEAVNIIDKIVASVGLKKNFIIKAANVPNAAAVVQGDKRYIYYSQSFINQIDLATSDSWAAISILAHEVGHHLNGHTIQAGGSRPSIELEADEFSGYVLKFMDCPSLSSAQKAMRTLGSESGSSTHPPKSARLEAIAVGWNKASEKLDNTANIPTTSSPKTSPTSTINKSSSNSSTRAYLELINLHCSSREDWLESDNIYINVNGQRVLSNKRMDAGDDLNKNDLSRIGLIPLSSKSITRIRVYDDDSGDFIPKDDLLLSFDAYIGVKESDEIEGSHGTGKYLLKYRIIYK